MEIQNVQDEVTIYDAGQNSLAEQQERAALDVMVSTAHRFPRNLKRSAENAIAIVSMNKAAAETCSYALPRGDKNITGASVHLARILAQCYGNIRIDSRVKEITATQVVSESIALDLENNYGVRVEVRRSIIGKHGRFNDDMITVTGNACNAIAYRNAVLAVIPKPIIDAVYDAAQNTISGDLSDEQKLIAKRKEVVDMFINNHGATEADVLKLCGKGAMAGIKRDDIVFLIGLLQAIKDGDTTADEVFGRNSTTAKTAEKLSSLANKGNQSLADKKQTKDQPKKEETIKPGGTLGFDNQKK
jgi:hypothetical protein